MHSAFIRRSRLSLESLEDRLAPATFTVTTTADAGAGSLCAAITAANAAAGADSIEFDIPGAGVRTINLASALPAITGRINIDGFTQPGVFLAPLIELNGAGAGAGAHGLNLSATAAGSFIRGLIINRFDVDGIRIRASNSRVEFCFIGTDSSGAVAQGNEMGVRILGGADGVRIGGNTVGALNLISGNDFAGVLITGAGTSGNRVQGNLIGTAGNGNTALPNNVGVQVSSGSTGNIIGGTVEAARNLISGNSTSGVGIIGLGTTGNAVRGNYIGTDRTGILPLGNGGFGVAIVDGADGNTVGGTTEGHRNLISANSLDGVVLDRTTGSIVQGNFIGTTVTGAAALGNLGSGVSVLNADQNLIGGPTAGAGNVIAGNLVNGVTFIDGATGNRVKGNLIGTRADGNAGLPNSDDGILIDDGSKNNVIGGVVALARNVISGNGNNGIAIESQGTTGNVVRGNFIGTRATAPFALPNGSNGVQIAFSASNNTVGGTAPGSRNVIAGNGLSGISIAGLNTIGNQVQGNFIGVDQSGIVALGNGSSGVIIVSSAAINLIGGPTPAAQRHLRQ